MDGNDMQMSGAAGFGNDTLQKAPELTPEQQAAQEEKINAEYQKVISEQ